MENNNEIMELTQEQKRELFFSICQTKEELKAHINAFLGIDLPDSTIDEQSTSSPMQFVWEVYQFMTTNKGPSRHVAAASRNAYKCLAEGTLIATPQGPKKIEEFKIGDVVYDENGKEIKVVGVWDQGEQECIDLINNNKVWATCTPNHIWYAAQTDKRKKNFGVYHDRRADQLGGTYGIKRVDLVAGELNDEIVKFHVRPAGKKHCWDLTVDSEKSLYCLQNGLVTHNTLSTSIIQFYSLIHCRRNSIQMSAILSQSQAAIDYVDRYLRLPDAAEYNITDNTRAKRLGGLPANELTGKDDAVLKVVTATKRGANSSRGSCLTGRTKIRTRKHIFAPVVLMEMSEIHEKIQNGQKINAISINPAELNAEMKEITHSIALESDKILIIKTKSGQIIECTKDHELATVYENGLSYSKAGHLNIGNNLCRFLNNQKRVVFDEIVSIEETDNPDPNGLVYDITVKDNHNFLINSIISSNCLIFDEVDLTPREILSEAAFISDPERSTGFNPVSVYISSRKTNSGPLQDLMDDAAKGSKTIRLHKWSIVDIMSKCPPEVHKPDQPIKAFLNTKNLKVLWSEHEFTNLINSTEKNIWMEINAFEGCKTCPAFIACQGRSVKQEGTAKTLRDRIFIGNLLEDVKTADAIIAQALNWKPDSSSIVLNNFERRRNLKKPIELYKWISGNYFNPMRLREEQMVEILNSDDAVLINSITPTKTDVYNLLRSLGWKIHYGVDWGMFDPAVNIVLAYHRSQKRCVVLDCESDTGYANPDWAKYIADNIWSKYPGDLICPDMEDAASPVYFGRLKIPCRNVKPMRIDTGVAQLKSLIFNPFTQTEHFAIFDDGEDGRNKIVVESFEKWSYKKNAMGFDYTKFEENSEYDHYIDPIRYALDPFVADFKIKYSTKQKMMDSEIPIKAAEGNTEALKHIEEKQRVENVFKDQLFRDHGLTDPFSKKDLVGEAINQEKNNSDKRGRIRFKF